MARQRHIPKGRPLMAGTVLLILLVAVVLASGRIINGIAVQMSGRIVTQISQYHYRLLQVEFERPVEVLTTAARFTHSHPAPSEAEMNVLTATLMQPTPRSAASGSWSAEKRSSAPTRGAEPPASRRPAKSAGGWSRSFGTIRSAAA